MTFATADASHGHHIGRAPEAVARTVRMRRPGRGARQMFGGRASGSRLQGTHIVGAWRCHARLPATE